MINLSASSESDRGRQLVDLAVSMRARMLSSGKHPDRGPITRLIQSILRARPCNFSRPLYFFPARISITGRACAIDPRVNSLNASAKYVLQGTRLSPALSASSRPLNASLWRSVSQIDCAGSAAKPIRTRLSLEFDGMMMRLICSRANRSRYISC